MPIVLKIKRRAPRPRPSRALFTLTAEPKLRQDGPTQGYLDGVIFTAQAPNALHKWHAAKSVNLVSDFGALLTEKDALEIVIELHLGRPVVVPGRYRIEQLRGRFGFDVQNDR